MQLKFWKWRPGRGRWASLALVALGLVLSGKAAAQVHLRITLQPDCFRSSLSAACDPRKTGDLANPRLDLGPQIAIWLESADGKRFIDTILVTKLTALLGLGNRPGYASLPSGPKFPYGRRPMVLPIWAHRRGKLYDSVVMTDGADKEFWLGFHESVSSPDPYFCRPMTFQEIDVDAVSCPTRTFNSVKGRFYDRARDLDGHSANGTPKPYVPPAQSYYPPRNDLITFTANDCDLNRQPPCQTSATKFAEINDLDLVAAATPPYGRPFTKFWRVPDDLAEGDYAVLVEVSKEFDNNERHRHPTRADEMLKEWGLTNNVGQPSVVYRVPFRLSRTTPTGEATTAIAGYSDFDGRTGTLHPPDISISETPGSGVGRLLVLSQTPSAGGAPLTGRVIVTTELGATTPVDPNPPGSDDAGAGDAGDPGGGRDGAVPPPPVCAVSSAHLVLTPDEVLAEKVTISFVEPPRPVWDQISEYVINYWNGHAQTEDAFTGGLPVHSVLKSAPGGRLKVVVSDLKSQSSLSVGVRARGLCGDGPIAFHSFTTAVREFTQLSGCFIATAAFGSPLARDVSLLRQLRDRAVSRAGLANAAAEVYGRSSPPVAELIGRSDASRAVTRGLLGPLVELARAFSK